MSTYPAVQISGATSNHGIYRKLPATSGQPIIAAEAMVFRYGISQIFHALKTGPFVPTPGERQRAAQLEHHFRTLCQRFVFALQDLNRLMQSLALTFSHRQFSAAGMRINFQAECLADHVLTYLNTIIDDVAIATALATEFTAAGPMDNMGKLRSPKMRGDPALASVKALLDDLDQAGSWWELAFAQKQGARQLLVHNQHLVGFQASSAPGGPFEVRAVLMSPFAQNTFASSDFFGLLRALLLDLFGWLDRLEIVLTSHLRTRSSSWSPTSTCPSFLLPVGYPAGITRYDEAYFPVPLCDGSDPLPWTVQVDLQHNNEEEQSDVPATSVEAYSGDQSRPFWVMVVNPRREPPQPKFHSGHDTLESAAQAVEVLQQKADEQAANEMRERKSEWLPYRYSAVARPE